METPQTRQTSEAQLRAAAKYAFRKKYGRTLDSWGQRCRTIGNRCAICRRTPQEVAGSGTRPRGLAPFGPGFLPLCASCTANFAWLKRRGHTTEPDAFVVDGLQLMRPVWVALRLTHEPAAGSILWTLHGAHNPYPCRSFQWTGAADAGPEPRLSDYLKPYPAAADAPEPFAAPDAPEVVPEPAGAPIPSTAEPLPVTEPAAVDAPDPAPIAPTVNRWAN